MRPLSCLLSIISPFSINKTFLNPELLSEDDILIFATEDILEIASPRKPFVESVNKSLDLEIFDVVCFKKHNFKSSSFIPIPLSEISIKVFPKSLTDNLISLDFASIEFSTNSLITEEGL